MIKLPSLSLNKNQFTINTQNFQEMCFIHLYSKPTLTCFYVYQWVARVCVFVCVCVCVCSSTVKASSVCKMSDTYLRGKDQRCCVVNIIRCASAKFLHLGILKCHISPPKTKTPALTNWRENDIIYRCSAKDNIN